MEQVKQQKHIADSRPRFPLMYYCACVVLYIIALPFLIVSIFRKKYRSSLPARFFPFMSFHRLKDMPEYWFHACSFGEIRSLAPIIDALKTSQKTILITTITHTGFNEAKRLYEYPINEHNNSHLSRVIVAYLPFEIFLPLWSKKCGKLRTLIVTEAEMWKMLFFLAKSHNAHTLLINARISEHSYKRYAYFTWFYQGIFTLIDEVLAQSHIDKERLIALGASNVEIFGNLKTLNPPTVSTVYTKPQKLVITAASTHKGEESIILEAFKAYKDSNENAILLLAPRHPERFKEVYELSSHQFPQTARFSQVQLESCEAYDVIVIDVLGELNNLYAISDIVILGGSFVKNVGGHNPLEPAFFETRLISGEHIFNQYALFEAVENYVLIPPQSLLDTLMRLQQLPKSRIKAHSKDKLHILLAKIQAPQSHKPS